MLESVILESSIIEVSELDSHPDYLQAKFVISDFDTNKNGVRLNRDTIEEWMSTLVGSPLLGKITKQQNNKGEDFASHEMKIVSFKGEDGKKHRKAVFDTSAFGVFTDVGIEKVDDVECIVATARVWKRFEKACKIIQERAENLKSSWEIATEKYTTTIEKGSPVKIIDMGRFIGHCCLGSLIPPAYDRTAVLEVASEQEDELNIALMEDLQNLNISSNIETEEKEVKSMQDNVEIITEQTAEVVDTVTTSETIETETPTETSEIVENTEQQDGDVVVEASTATEEQTVETSNEETPANDTVEQDAEVSALTSNDLRCKLERAFDKLVDAEGHRYCGWCYMLFPADNTAWFRECGRDIETELIEVKYTVENDNVTITETNKVVLTVSPREINQVIAQKDNAIIEMSAQIQSLNDKVAELQPYKDKIDEIEKAEKEAQFEKDKKELSDYAISSGYITTEELETSEELKGYIEKLDKASIKSLIADRVVASLTKKVDKVDEVETSTKNETQPNVQLNLTAEQTEKTVSDYNWIIKTFIGK